MRFVTSVCQKNTIFKSKMEHFPFFFFEQFETLKNKNFSVDTPTSATITNTSTTTIPAETTLADMMEKLSNQLLKQTCN